jgi:hypothetical protein
MNKYKTDYLVSNPSAWSGIARLFDISGSYDRYNTSDSSVQADLRAINNDWNVTLQDFRREVEEAKHRLHGEAR